VATVPAPKDLLIPREGIRKPGFLTASRTAVAGPGFVSLRDSRTDETTRV